MQPCWNRNTQQNFQNWFFRRNHHAKLQSENRFHNLIENASRSSALKKRSKEIISLEITTRCISTRCVSFERNHFRRVVCLDASFGVELWIFKKRRSRENLSLRLHTYRNNLEDLTLTFFFEKTVKIWKWQKFWKNWVWKSFSLLGKLLN